MLDHVTHLLPCQTVDLDQHVPFAGLLFGLYCDGLLGNFLGPSSRAHNQKHSSENVCDSSTNEEMVLQMDGLCAMLDERELAYQISR